MRKEKCMFQMKEQSKTQKKKKPNEMEISNLPEKQIKAMVIKCSPNSGK